MTDEPFPGAETRDDRTLLSDHLAGDPDAFGELFRRHRDRLWAIALRTTCNPEDAADALQDAMVNAFRAAGTFRGEAAVTTWLHRVVVNACVDIARRRSVRPWTPLPDDDRSTRLADPNPDPLASQDLRLDVTAALARLPLEQRAALVLVDMQGYSVDEAAHILQCAPGTVKSRCARGRARLLLLLTAEEPTQPFRNQPGPANVTTTFGPTVIESEGGQPA